MADLLVDNNTMISIFKKKFPKVLLEIMSKVLQSESRAAYYLKAIEFKNDIAKGNQNIPLTFRKHFPEEFNLLKDEKSILGAVNRYSQLSKADEDIIKKKIMEFLLAFAASSDKKGMALKLLSSAMNKRLTGGGGRSKKKCNCGCKVKKSSKKRRSRKKRH